MRNVPVILVLLGRACLPTVRGEYAADGGRLKPVNYSGRPDALILPPAPVRSQPIPYLNAHRLERRPADGHNLGLGGANHHQREVRAVTYADRLRQQRRWSFVPWLVGAVVLAGVGAAGTVGGWLVLKSRATNVAPRPASEVVKVSAEELSMESRGNAVATEAKYAGKIVEITGVVESVKSNFNGQWICLNGERTADVEIWLAVPHMKHLAALKPGETLTARGTYKKHPIHSHPTVINCELVGR